MLVSVIIPVYNEEKVIGECLESLVKQSYEDFEVIVVDDGSTDDSLGIVRNFQFSPKKLLRNLTGQAILNFQLRVLRQEHEGAGAARNRGAKEAKGEILVFVDADMTFDRSFLEELVEPIRRGKAIGSFSSEEYLASGDNVWARCWNLNRGLPEERMHGDDYPKKQKVFRAILKREFERVGGFDEKAGYIDDWSLAEKLGQEAVRVKGAVFYHRNPSSLREAFVQARWMAKRKYRLGWLGVIGAMLRVSLPISVVKGVFGTIRFGISEYFVFKLLVDVASFLGIVEFNLGKKVSK